jgi:hypothetical protein
MTAPEIVLLLVVVVGSAFGIGILRRIRRQVDAARISDGDGMRRLTVEERIALARHLARQRSPWLWPLVGAASLSF